jgi:NAD(P)-dependent dehydrogenase (short-subunit alcohol dehydrogenase family)
VFSATVREELAFGPLQLGQSREQVAARVDDVLAMLDLVELADRAPYQLSGGQKKKVAIASVLVMNPEVLLVDEPTAALDPRGQQWLVELLEQLGQAGKTIVLATHDLEVLDRVADRCLIFSEDHRLVAQGTPAEVLADRELLRVNLIHAHARATTWRAARGSAAEPAAPQAVRAEPGDRVVAEVGPEAVLLLDRAFQLLQHRLGHLVLGAAGGAGEMRVLRLAHLVVAEAVLQVHVGEHAEPLQPLQGAVDGRGAHPRHPRLDPPDHRQRHQVAGGPHDLVDDRDPLRGHPHPLGAQQLDRGAGVSHATSLPMHLHQVAITSSMRQGPLAARPGGEPRRCRGSRPGRRDRGGDAPGGAAMSRVAIVTGSDSGIGEATAIALAGAGCDVGVTWHRDEAGAKQTAAKVRAAGRRAAVARLDLLRLPKAAGVVDRLAEELGGLDVLVNNAGTGVTTPFLEQSLQDWRRVVDTDLTGAFVCAQAAARRMVAAGRGGRIVNVTSVHEHVPLVGAAAYCAAKGGLGLLTKVMALELAEHGILVNAVAPGEVATAMTGNEDVDPGTVERAGIPLGRPGHAGEIAAAIAWLASEEASYVTGASFVVDGGLLLMAAVANSS